MATTPTKTIAFIHGLWMHRTSWQAWEEFFQSNGYKTVALSWPGDSDTIAASRANPEPIGNRGVKEIADYLEQQIKALLEKPILIGHSFGGLLTQILLGRGVAVAGVAIDPAPIKGVWQLPFSALRASFGILGNPFNINKAVSLSFDEFRFGFANAVSEQEARELYEKWPIPAPARPLFQAAMATFIGSETKVNTDNTTRGPLLITAGENDHIAPPIFGQASLEKYNKSVVPEFKEFENRGHSLILDSGWKEVAQYSLEWLKGKGF
ncbi:MAG: alpha/beta hydrolase [Bacteroidetes bacterium]|nr:alpha/beta hydrolase [Bacteroidota bacterium]